jgi:RNA polymerase sigma-54 factor
MKQALQMKQGLQMRTAQSLAMTPQLQQSLRLLQLSALEFEQEILRSLAENPFLEREEESNAAAADPAGEAAEADAPSQIESSASSTTEALGESLTREDLLGERWTGRAPAANGSDDADVGAYTACPVSLHEHLLEQVRCSRLGERDKLLAGLVVEAVDEDGYLRQSFDDLASVLPESEIDPEDLAIALRFVQSLEPAGVGARTPSECLELQILRLPTDRPGRDLALEIVRSHLNVLAAHDTPRLLRDLACDEAALRKANDLILSLDPRPGSTFGATDARYVVADVVVQKKQGRWIAGINPHVLPRIRVNELYSNIFRNAREANSGLSQQLQEARWLVRNAQQRFQTIQRVAQAIVERQSRFFDYGDVAMKPLLQRDIAREVGVHESTVSRVASGKYMSTPRGLIEFKHFFGTQVVAEDGHACSSTAVRALIRHIVAHEIAGNPLSDIKITRKLGEYGVRVARRTVTKYRDAMRIPPVEARRLSAHGMAQDLTPRS